MTPLADGGDPPGDGAVHTFEAVSGVVFEMTTRPDSPLLETFYALYDQAFVLPDEKEDLDGFRECLALGQGPERARLKSLYGPHRELVCLAREAPGAPVFGGANLIAHPVPGGRIAANLNYVFIDRAARGGGRFRKLAKAIEELATALFAPPYQPAAIFFELNDPLLLSEADYTADSAQAGLDQVDRLAIWSRLGARIVDLDYIQPPLSTRQQPETGLLYCVYGDLPPGGAPAGMLLAHLERFFGVSVLKGADPWSHAVAGPQLNALRDRAARGEVVALLDPAPVIEEVRRVRARGGPRPGGVRALLRG